MKIMSSENKYMFVEFTKEDMMKMDITYDKLDYSNSKTKVLVHSLLNEAKNILGYSFCLPEKINVEAFPTQEGGCLLLFTVRIKPAKYKVKNKNPELFFTFNGYNEMFDLASNISQTERGQIKSSLYLYNENYILNIRGKLKHSFLSRINEFAFPIKLSFQEKNKLKEYGKCIIGENALEILGGRFS